MDPIIVLGAVVVIGIVAFVMKKKKSHTAPTMQQPTSGSGSSGRSGSSGMHR